MSHADTPSAHEAEQDGRGALNIADRFREAVREDGGGTSWQDSERGDVLQAAAEGGADVSVIEAALADDDAGHASDMIDETIGHQCLACEAVVKQWCPDYDNGVCPGCHLQDADDYEEAQERGKVREYLAFTRRTRRAS